MPQRHVQSGHEYTMPVASPRGSACTADHQNSMKRKKSSERSESTSRRFGVPTNVAVSNRGDVLPQAYVRAFATLQDQCPPRAWSKMEALLREDACAVGELIDTVDEAPLGAASTGQAHLATLRDGRRVVLKIQYPEAKGRFQSDFGNVQRLVRIALPALVPVIREVRRRFAPPVLLACAHSTKRQGRPREAVAPPLRVPLAPPRAVSSTAGAATRAGFRKSSTCR